VVSRAGRKSSCAPAKPTAISETAKINRFMRETIGQEGRFHNKHFSPHLS
jgi:hypothetical protein